jgi:GntR family transcriptional regulator/MocR family aminotransferase
MSTVPILNIAIALPGKGSRELLRTLHRQLKTAIIDGRLKPGLRLPPTRALAKALGISRNTAIAAYDMLLSEGYVDSRQGAGTFVADLGTRFVRPEPLTDDGEGDPRLAAPWRGSRPVKEFRGGDSYRFDFVAGVPSMTFPFDIWQRLLARASRRVARRQMQERDPAGEPELRAAIASHVSFVRAVSCRAEDIVVTAGTRQAIDLIARILVTRGETEVAVEDPGYGPTRRSLQAAGARLRPIPVDCEGLIVERLTPSVRIVCATPSHQFPLGVVLSAARRAALMEFAARNNAAIIEDDYDSEFLHGGSPLDALQTLDRSNCVFYVGTFSKSMFPELRLGFVVVPPWALSALTLAKQLCDGHPPLIPQLALADFISEGHLARHVRRMRRVYSKRYLMLSRSIEERLQGRLEPYPARAGVHLAARADKDFDEQALVRKAGENGIRVEDIGRYAFGPACQRGLVFGFGMIEAGDIDPAIETLARLA